MEKMRNKKAIGSDITLLNGVLANKNGNDIIAIIDSLILKRSVISISRIYLIRTK
ncbi:hypothetical protein WBP_0958 [Wolbachia endosymbiont of Brugia pahangi]|nr:hypothetical protein WBP_0958 [Wolbachia endosymbiont of Brugia pahangi]